MCCFAAFLFFLESLPFLFCFFHGSGSVLSAIVVLRNAVLVKVCRLSEDPMARFGVTLYAETVTTRVQPRSLLCLDVHDEPMCEDAGMRDVLRRLPFAFRVRATQRPPPGIENDLPHGSWQLRIQISR